ncbi:MAG: hypothetical protein ACTSQE_08960 [Candidatus Heimdallarchaeaceae archaeon]
MIYSTIQPCKKQTGFEALPEITFKIELEEIKEPLLTVLQDFELKRETKVVLILIKKGTDKKLSVFPSGKVMAYRVSEEEAREIFERISKVFEERLEKSN